MSELWTWTRLEDPLYGSGVYTEVWRKSAEPRPKEKDRGYVDGRTLLWLPWSTPPQPYALWKEGAALKRYSSRWARLNIQDNGIEDGKPSRKCCIPPVMILRNWQPPFRTRECHGRTPWVKTWKVRCHRVEPDWNTSVTHSQYKH